MVGELLGTDPPSGQGRAALPGPHCACLGAGVAVGCGRVHTGPVVPSLPPVPCLRLMGEELVFLTRIANEDA